MSFLRRRENKADADLSFDALSSPLASRGSASLGGLQHGDRRAELEQLENYRSKSPLERRRLRRLDRRTRRLGFTSAGYWTPRRVAFALATLLVVALIVYGFAVAQKHRVGRGRGGRR